MQDNDLNLIMQFITKLEELRGLIDPNKASVSMVHHAASLYKERGANCSNAINAVRLFWLDERNKSIELISELYELAKKLPGDNALDTDTFSYELAKRKINERRK